MKQTYLDFKYFAFRNLCQEVAEKLSKQDKSKRWIPDQGNWPRWPTWLSCPTLLPQMKGELAQGDMGLHVQMLLKIKTPPVIWPVLFNKK